MISINRPTKIQSQKKTRFQDPFTKFFYIRNIISNKFVNFLAWFSWILLYSDNDNDNNLLLTMIIYMLSCWYYLKWLVSFLVLFILFLSSKRHLASCLKNQVFEKSEAIIKFNLLIFKVIFKVKKINFQNYIWEI